MHVLVTADTVGGVWTYTRELVTGLTQRGIRVTLVSFGEIPAAKQTEWLNALGTVDFYPTAFRLEWMHEAEQDIEASSDFLMSIIDETKPDLLHLNQFCYGTLAVSIPKIVVAHSDVVSWWAAVKNEEPDDIAWMRWYRETISRGLDGANAVVAPTNWMLRQVETWYGALAPAGTPAAIVGRLNTEISRTVKRPDMQERMAGEGLDPAGGPPEQFRDVLKRDIPKWVKVVKAANIQTIQ